MSIATAISNAQAKVAAAYTALQNKGATMPSTQDLSNMPATINSIQTGGTPVLPYDAEIEYLQSSGTQYIDINIFGNDLLEYEVKYLWTSGDWRYVLGAQTSDSADRFSLMTGSWSNRRVYYNNGGSSNEKYYTITAGEQAAPIISRKVYYDIFLNTAHKGYFSAVTYTTPVTIYVFAKHQGTTYESQFIGRLYYLKIGNLDLIPVRVGQVGYLYDKVSGELFGNSGTGNFTLGPDVI